MIFDRIGPVLPVVPAGALSIIMRNIPFEKSFVHTLVAVIKEVFCPAIKDQLKTFTVK